MKIHSVRAELFHADRQIERQRDMIKLIITFPYFANTPRYVLLFSMCTDQWLLNATSGAYKSIISRIF